MLSIQFNLYKCEFKLSSGIYEYPGVLKGHYTVHGNANDAWMAIYSTMSQLSPLCSIHYCASQIPA